MRRLRHFKKAWPTWPHFWFEATFRTAVTGGCMSFLSGLIMIGRRYTPFQLFSTWPAEFALVTGIIVAIIFAVLAVGIYAVWGDSIPDDAQ